MGYQSLQIWMASQHICTIASEIALLLFRWKSNNRDFALREIKIKQKQIKTWINFWGITKKHIMKKRSVTNHFNKAFGALVLVGLSHIKTQ